MSEVKNENQEYFDFLDDMMDSGGSNMFQAPMMLRECFDMSKGEALKIFIAWKDTKQCHIMVGIVSDPYYTLYINFIMEII